MGVLRKIQVPKGYKPKAVLRWHSNTATSNTSASHLHCADSVLKRKCSNSFSYCESDLSTQSKTSNHIFASNSKWPASPPLMILSKNSTSYSKTMLSMSITSCKSSTLTKATLQNGRNSPNSIATDILAIWWMKVTANST